MHDGLYKAWRVLTMDPHEPEIYEAGILVQNDRIVALDRFAVLRGTGPVYDLGRVTLCPGLINAHTHLGMSHLQGQIPKGLGFKAWADRIFSLRHQPFNEFFLFQNVEAMRAMGLAVLTDIVGGHGEQIRAILGDSGLTGFFFYELSGQCKGNLTQKVLPDKSSLAVHALYSIDPEYARQIKAWCHSTNRPFSLHLAEVPGENELFIDGKGEFADFLRFRKILPKSFVAPGTSVVSFAQSLGLLDPKTLAVHCVQVSETDLGFLADSGASVCLCPRSNTWIGVGEPQALAMYQANIPLCLGTDSLGSNESLNLWAELAVVQQLLPKSLTLPDLLALITINPAKVLGLEKDFGILAVGRTALWAVVPKPWADMH